MARAPGGGPGCSIRSTPARLPTPTETGTATVAGIVEPSRPSGLAGRRRHLAQPGHRVHPMPTGATTWPTTWRSSLIWARRRRRPADRRGRAARHPGLMDLVPNHTSDQHPWFVDSRSSRTADHRHWYVWADPKPDGSPPNNWVSSFGGPAWTLDDTTGQYYLHNHLDEQPDLNWWNEEVRQAFDGIMEYWMDRGVSGFRIDVCNIIIKDALLRDNPPSTDDRPPGRPAVRAEARLQRKPARGPRGDPALAPAG